MMSVNSLSEKSTEKKFWETTVLMWGRTLLPVYCFDKRIIIDSQWDLLKVLFSNIGVFFSSSKNMATHEELESVRWRIHLSHIITGLSKLDQSESIVLL